MATFTRVFQPGMIGPMEVRNRLIKPGEGIPTSEIYGYMTDRVIRYYEERAKGGVGMVTVGVTSIFMEAPASPYYPAMFDDTYIPGHQKQTESIHKWGAKANLQICHHGGSISRRLSQFPKDKFPHIDVIAPSAMVFPGGVVPAREMTKEDIRHVILGFAQAARRAKKAGYDSVEIHGSGMALVNQFRSPLFNKRTDAFGGTVEKRARFLCEILEAMRQEVGKSMAIIVKATADDQIEGGLTLADSFVQLPMFVEAGADAFLVTAGVTRVSPGGALGMSFLYPLGNQVKYAAAIKRVVKATVIANARIDLPTAERVLREGKADFIAMLRPLIADPHLPNKAREGRYSEIRRCNYCDTCVWPFISMEERARLKGRGFACSVNPNIGDEGDPDWELKPALSPKKVIVIGGGIAGMEAAHTAAQRGHQVVLYEKSSQLGGRWNVAALRKGRRMYLDLVRSLKRDLARSGVQVIMNQEVTRDLVKEIRPDIAIVATGSVAAPLDMPGLEGKKVVLVEDVLLGTAKLGDRVVVIGNVNPAGELALMLADKAKRVSLVVVADPRRPAGLLFDDLRDRLVEKGVYIYPNSSIVSLTEGGVGINMNFGTHGMAIFLRADTIIASSLGNPESKLKDELIGIVPETYAIGDCVSPRSASVAIREGAEIGRQI